MAEQHTYTLKIDTAFKKLIPELSAEELLRLEENIIQDGCREPLFVWKSTILDGHNRYEICTKLQIPFTIQRVYLKNREEAIAWICANQLNRRNITEEARRYLIGKRCEIEKILGTHNTVETRQYIKKDFTTNTLPKLSLSASISWTRERISEEYGISQASIFNYEKYAQALDLISHILPELTRKILSSEIKLSIEHIIAFSQLPVQEIHELAQLTSDDCKEFALNLRNTLLKKKNLPKIDSLQMPACSIKEMPAYDPDAEISNIILTIPSWISSINRACSATDFNDVTDNAYHKLEQELIKLKETINNMLTALKGVN